MTGEGEQRYHASTVSTTSLAPESKSTAAANKDAANPPVTTTEPSNILRRELPSHTAQRLDGAPPTSEERSTSRQMQASSNKYELSIIPDEDSIIDDPHLKNTPYIVNIKHMVLICTDCRHCINPDSMATHLRRLHPHCKVGADFVTKIIAKFPELVNETVHPPEATGPVFGLGIPAEEYTVCARCRRGYLNISTWRHHVCGKPGVDLEGRAEHFTSFVQTFFRGRNICYFPIKLPVSMSDEALQDDFDLFKSGFQDIRVSEDDLGESEDYRELNQFLLKEGWIKHVSGHSQAELSTLTAPPKEDEPLEPIFREVVALMSNIQDAIKAAGYHVRRLLGRRPS